MFSRIKTFFTENLGVTAGEIPVTADGESIPVATIRQMKNGRYRLLSGEFGNEVVATYARYRDAIRGAERRGLTVVEQVVGA